MKTRSGRRRAAGACVAALLAAGLLAAACGDKTPQPKSASPAPAATPAPAALPAPPKPPERYAATLQEGIQFNRHGWPEFISSVTGFSGRENFGRWTVGPTVRIAFSEPLPRKFTLELVGGAFGPNQGQPVGVSIGAFKANVTFKGVPYAKEAEVRRIAVELKADADAIELAIPKPTAPAPPGKGDDRLLGIGLVRLSVVTKS
jgi:hypothetical protein